MWRSFQRSTFSLAENVVKSNQFSHCKSSLTLTAKRMASSSADKLTVIHDEAEHEFFIPLKSPDGATTQKAVLQYYEIKPGYIDLEHTVVPVEFRGHGIAKVLAQAAFDHFVEKKVDIRPTCTYLQKFYKDNPLPQYKERVKWDASL